MAGVCFFKTEIVIPQSCIEISTKCRVQIDFELIMTAMLTKYEAGSSIEPPRLPTGKSTRRHYSTTGGPIWMKSDSLMQNSMPVKAIWSK